MKYVIQELELNVPEPFQDRSVNALLLGAKQPPDFNLVISRDIVPTGESLEHTVKKQIQVISSSQESFKETHPSAKRTVAREDGGQTEGIELAIRYKTKGTVFYQRHLYASLGGRKILIIVGTAVGLWEAKDEATWNGLIDSLRLK